VILLAATGVAQELSQDVYPSEDELYQAWIEGEIDDYQYAVLAEIITSGADSSSLYLLDEIPNLSYFLRSFRSLETDLEHDQAAAFLPERHERSAPRVKVSHEYSSELAEEPASRYRSHANASFGRGWSTDVRLHRDYGGAERIVRRSAGYRSSDGRRRLTLGSFTARLGLGAAFGYHGKILDYSDRLDAESWRAPDFGGYNGFYFRERRALDVQLLVSSNRDIDHELNTAAVMIADTRGALRPGVVVGVNRVRERATGATLYDVKYGGATKYKYAGGYAAGEATVQAGARPSFAAAVFEGSHRLQDAQVEYAGWSYDDNYLDLAGGSKAGNLRRTVVLEEVDLEYSDKRSGQAGGMLKTIVLLSDRIELISSFLGARRGRDTSRVQFMTGAVYRSSDRSSITADYLLRDYRNNDTAEVRESRQHRTRAEWRYRDQGLAIRTEIAYVTQRQRPDGLGMLTHVKLYNRPWGSCEAWVNLSRITVEVLSVENGYGYVRSVQNISDGASVAVKLSHRYSRGASDKHRTTFSVELALQY